MTQTKVHLNGYRRYMGLIAQHLGASENVPPFLGGTCKCQICSNKVLSDEDQRIILKRQAEARQWELEDANRARELDLCRDISSSEQPYMSTLRLLILAFCISWLMLRWLQSLLLLNLQSTGLI